MIEAQLEHPITIREENFSTLHYQSLQLINKSRERNDISEGSIKCEHEQKQTKVSVQISERFEKSP